MCKTRAHFTNSTFFKSLKEAHVSLKYESYNVICASIEAQVYLTFCERKQICQPEENVPTKEASLHPKKAKTPLEMRQIPSEKRQIQMGTCAYCEEPL